MNKLDSDIELCFINFKNNKVPLELIQLKLSSEKQHSRLINDVNTKAFKSHYYDVCEKFWTYK